MSSDLSPNQDFPVNTVWINGIERRNLHIKVQETGIEIFEKKYAKKSHKYFYFFVPISAGGTGPKISGTEISFYSDYTTHIIIDFGNNSRALEFVRSEIEKLKTKRLDVSDITSESEDWNPASQSSQPTESDVLDDIGRLFEMGLFSDVILCANDETELRAHKGILSCRSPVFASMFEAGMEESKTNRVQIKDVNSEVLKEMLRFIYTGRIDNLEKVSFGLLPAGDKYNIKGLKELCEKYLCSALTVENVSEALILGERHSCNQLKSIALDFITTQAVDVMKTDGWKSMTDSDPSLVLDVLNSVAVSAAQQMQCVGPPRPPLKRIKLD